MIPELIKKYKERMGRADDLISVEIFGDGSGTIINFPDGSLSEEILFDFSTYEELFEWFNEQLNQKDNED